MPRQKSTHGQVRKIYLRYRENDPLYTKLNSLIEGVPAGKRNACMLHALLVGLTQASGPPDPQAMAAEAISEALPSDDTGTRQEYGSGAVSLFTQF